MHLYEYLQWLYLSVFSWIKKKPEPHDVNTETLVLFQTFSQMES